MMRRLFFILTFVLMGCDREPPALPPVDVMPPDGSAHYTDAEGQERTLFRPVGMLAYGEQAQGGLPPAEALIGYEFAGSAGDTPSLILDLPGGGLVSMALYGARDDTGLWGRPLAAMHGERVLRIAGVELPADGYYFVLIRRLDGPPIDYTLALDCEGCVATCAAVPACDLYCDQGYDLDGDGCRACSCVENLCANDDECLEGEVCRDGVCREAPSCEAQCDGERLEPVCSADGRTLPNRCVASCLGVDEIEPGPCVDDMCGPDRPCPGGNACLDGRCVCECPDVEAPVCSRLNNTYTNACEMACQGEALAYEGRCVGPTEGRCSDASPCSPGRVCAAGPDGEGFCTIRCRLHDPRACNRFGSCVDLPDAGAVCLPFCRGEDMLQCPGQFECIPGPDGRPVCAPPCDCPEGGEPVCADGRVTYDSACAAACVGVGEERLEAGACVDQPPPPDCSECPSVWAPVCADDQLRSTLCDSECGPPTRQVEPASACYAAPIETACRVDEDCMRTGCEDSVCAAAPAERACARLGLDAQCYVTHGACGCIDNQCGFRAEDRDLGVCLERVRAARP